MDKTHILEEIRRIATESGGKPPGRESFETHSGIRMSAWYPHLWLRWSDALAEAGFSANTLQRATSSDVIVEKYIQLARDLNHLPVEGELRRRAKLDKAFPSHSVFRKFGGKDKLVDEVLRYCKKRTGYEDMVGLCENFKTTSKHAGESPYCAALRTGFVYLMKSGRHYKIGHTNSVGSRERQLTIKIPVPPTTIHSIETDDPVGVEAYWHKRFEAKRGEGEWFTLSPEDVHAFKRWKKLV